MGSAKLTHLDKRNRPAMVDVGAKAVTLRSAVAEACLRMPRAVGAALRAAAADDNVRAVVLHVDSPGGSAASGSGPARAGPADGGCAGQASGTTSRDSARHQPLAAQSVPQAVGQSEWNGSTDR